MSKTIKQWLETLPEPYRSEALENLEEYVSKKLVVSLAGALVYAFKWRCTEQGFEYWDILHQSIFKCTFEVKQIQDRITLLEAKHGVTLSAPPETQQEYQQLKKELETKIHRL